MTFKSLLTVVTDPETAGKHVSAMADLASGWDAHADALCLGVDRSQTGYYYAGTNALVLQESLEQAQEVATEVLGVAKSVLEPSGLRWTAEDGISQLADLGRHVAGRARFSDLVIAGKPYGPNIRTEAEMICEAALFEGQAPVLIVPDNCNAPVKPKTVLLAWNESREAMIAARRALPLLKAADLVRIVVINPPQHGPDRSDPGGQLGQMLARHGVQCDIDILGKSLTRVSDVLCRHTIDTGADLIVMGAYGHSRFREGILGGATRNMLERAEVPVFLAH